MALFKQTSTFKYLLLIFALSFLLRLPNLNRPLANQWELCTGISLVQLDIWQRKGAENFNYLLPVNYPGVKDIQIQNWPAYKDVKDKSGNHYYLSFPPFYLLVPYFLNKLFSFPISPLSLQLLNILFHFLALLLILKISRLAFQTESQKVDIIGLTACFIYTFSPSPLWFHTNIYIMFPVAIPILLVSTYSFLRISKYEAQKLKHYLLLGGALFLLSYTEWVGFLTSFTYAILSAILFIQSKNKKYIVTLFTAGLAATLALALFLWQGAAAVGLENLINYHFARYNDYAGTAEGSHFLLFLSRFALWFIRGYAPVVLALSGLCLFLLFKKQSLDSFKKYKAGLLLATLIIPSALHHLLLRDFTVHHEFSTLIDGLTLSFVGGIIVHYIIESQIIKKCVLIGLGLIVLLANSTSFFLQHLPGSTSYNGYPYDVAQKIGTTIHQNTQGDEPVFLVGYNRHYEWQLLWYAKTNVGFCKDFAELRRKMEELKLQKAKAFILDSSFMYTGKIASFKEVSLNDNYKAVGDGY